VVGRKKQRRSLFKDTGQQKRKPDIRRKTRNVEYHSITGKRMYVEVIRGEGCEN